MIPCASGLSSRLYNATRFRYKSMTAFFATTFTDKWPKLYRCQICRDTNCTELRIWMELEPVQPIDWPNNIIQPSWPYACDFSKTKWRVEMNQNFRTSGSSITGNFNTYGKLCHTTLISCFINNNCTMLYRRVEKIRLASSHRSESRVMRWHLLEDLHWENI